MSDSGWIADGFRMFDDSVWGNESLSNSSAGTPLYQSTSMVSLATPPRGQHWTLQENAIHQSKIAALIEVWILSLICMKS